MQVTRSAITNLKRERRADVAVTLARRSRLRFCEMMCGFSFLIDYIEAIEYSKTQNARSENSRCGLFVFFD